MRHFPSSGSLHRYDFIRWPIFSGRRGRKSRTGDDRISCYLDFPSISLQEGNRKPGIQAPSFESSAFKELQKSPLSPLSEWQRQTTKSELPVYDDRKPHVPAQDNVQLNDSDSSLNPFSFLSCSDGPSRIRCECAGTGSRADETHVLFIPTSFHILISISSIRCEHAGLCARADKG